VFVFHAVFLVLVCVAMAGLADAFVLLNRSATIFDDPSAWNVADTAYTVCPGKKKIPKFSFVSLVTTFFFKVDPGVHDVVMSRTIRLAHHYVFKS
jgi:hypothetical protein